MNPNVSNEISDVMSFIKASIKKAERINDYGQTWKKIIAANYGVNYDPKYISKKFSQEAGMTIYDFFRKHLFISMIPKYVSKVGPLPNSKRDSYLGLPSFKLKAETFYKMAFEDIILKVTAEIKENAEMFDEMKNSLESLSDYLYGYYIDEDREKIYMKFNPVSTTLYILDRFRPIRLDQAFKRYIESINDADAKKLALLGIEKLISGDFSKEMEVSFSDDEISDGFSRLDTYDLEKPLEYGDAVIYVHDFLDSELLLITGGLKEDFETIFNCIEFSIPQSISIDYIELFKYFSTRCPLSLAQLAKKARRSEKYIINLVIDLFKRGFCFISRAFPSTKQNTL